MNCSPRARLTVSFVPKPGSLKWNAYQRGQESVPAPCINNGASTPLAKQRLLLLRNSFIDTNVQYRVTFSLRAHNTRALTENAIESLPEANTLRP